MSLKKIGLVGARGHTGRVLLQLISHHEGLVLEFASSREFNGCEINSLVPEYFPKAGGATQFVALEPDDIANIVREHDLDALILAMPDGVGEKFVEALNGVSEKLAIIDLSADFRFFDNWVYGLPELLRFMGKDDDLNGAKYIANPGCYATAIQLGLAPAQPYLKGIPSTFGVSGYSGAGTKPSPKNDVNELANNLMPYKLTGHTHEREATRHLGFPIFFTPHVHPAFSGILVTLHLEFQETIRREFLINLYQEAYENEPLITILEEAPNLKMGTGNNGLMIGGFELSSDGRHGVIVAVEDNLRKGAAVQAMQNVNRALGFEEFMGLTVSL